MKFAKPESATSPTRTFSIEKAQDVLSERREPDSDSSLDREGMSHGNPGDRKTQKKSKMLVVGLPLLLLVAGFFLFLPTLREKLSGESFDPSLYVTQEVKRGPFQISVTERGNVQSLKNATLANRVEGMTTIISLVPEGTLVEGPVVSTVEGRVSDITSLSQKIKTVTVAVDPVVAVTPFFFVYLNRPEAEHTVMLGEHTEVLVDVGDSVKVGDFLAGDVVCELDASLFEDKLREQRITITKAGGELKKARTNVETQFNQNESDIAAAVLAKVLAELDLKKFIEGDSVQDEFVARAEITVAEQELAQAEEAYEYTKKNVKLGFENLTRQESDRITLVDKRLKLDIAKGKLTVLKKYDFKRFHAEFEANAVESVRALERAKLTAKQGLEFFQAEYDAANETFDFEMRKLERLQKQLSFCKLVAPQDGKVVYANQRSRRSEPAIIEVGVQVYQRQKIINLPDFSQMKVEAKIHESKISHIQVGQHVRIRVNAFPDRVFTGVMEVVPDVPVRGEWPNHDQMLYETEIRIIDDVSDLKPGMNAELEIIAEERDDVLQIPIQSLIAVGDKYISFVLGSKGPEIRRDVKIGASNDKTVEILAGLEEGEIVVMNPRTLFEDKISTLQSEYDNDESKKRAQSGKQKQKEKRQAAFPDDAGTNSTPEKNTEKKNKQKQGSKRQPGEIKQSNPSAGTKVTSNAGSRK